MIGPPPKTFHQYRPRRQRKRPRFPAYRVPTSLCVSLNRESVAYGEKVRQITEHMMTLPQRARTDFADAVFNGNATLPERGVH